MTLTYILSLLGLTNISLRMCTDRRIYDKERRVGIRIEGSKEKVVVEYPPG